MADFALRPLNAESESEVALVAERMRLTLMEVVGSEEGRTMYSMEWLVARVRWHLDAENCTGAVFVAQSANEVVGHTIVRVEKGEGDAIGLFSTTYVAKWARRRGIANALIEAGESWMRKQGMHCAATHTSESNTPLIRLYEKHQYSIALRDAESKMIRLEKSL